MGAIFILLAPLMAIFAPIEFVIESSSLIYEPVAEVISDWMVYFGV